MQQNPFLLSIIIPTKNRPHTCLFAIESVLLLNKPDIEIVVQDCSDSDILKQKINAKFNGDNRIKYQYTHAKPSMTENWNMAFFRASGEYMCGIGDDDAVLPNIYDVTVHAKQNKIDAVGHSKRYEYFWDDFTITPSYAAKLRIPEIRLSKKIKKYDRTDLDTIIKKQAAIPNMDYRQLPMVYHCLLSGTLIDKLIQKTGKFLDGTSLDVYSAFTIGLLVNKFYVYDEPFTLPGACGASNTNRSVLKKVNSHFSEFKVIDFDNRIPNVHNLTFSIAESTQKAFANLKNTSLPTLLDLPALYIDFLFYDFNVKMFKYLFLMMKENKFKLKDYFKFMTLFIKIILSRSNRKITYLLQKIRPSKSANPSMLFFKADNILEAIEILTRKSSGAASIN